jgi:transcriptional regulator with XRE-family HTH domain
VTTTWIAPPPTPAQYLALSETAGLGSAVARRRLAAELRQLRERRHRPQDAVARALGWQTSRVSCYECSTTLPTAREVARMLDYYQVHGAGRAFLLRLAEAATKTWWWDSCDAGLAADRRELIALEHDAAALCVWQPKTVPALLQTAAYAQHIAASPYTLESRRQDQAGRRAAVTMKRQQILDRVPPPDVTVILDELALRQPAAGDQVMDDQLHHLLRERPGLTVRVLPLAVPCPVPCGPFTLLRFGSLAGEIVAASHLTGVCFVEDEPEICSYWLAFQALADAALSPAASRSRIREIMAGSAPRRLAGNGPPGAQRRRNRQPGAQCPSQMPAPDAGTLHA